MNRRSFATLLGATFIAPQSLRQATPAATPASTSRPDPIDLGSGVTLIDYRLHPGQRPAVIGEIRNDSDRMIDAPVISLTWPRSGDHDNGFTWAPPILPVIAAGASVPIFGPLPEDENSDGVLKTATFARCSLAEPGEYTAREEQFTLVVQKLEEDINEDASYRCQGTVTNIGKTTATDTMVRGIVRDASGRVAGCTASPFTNIIEVDETKQFTLWAGSSVANKANPSVLVSGTDYTVELTAGTRGPVVSPGCTFGLPWD